MYIIKVARYIIKITITSENERYSSRLFVLKVHSICLTPYYTSILKHESESKSTSMTTPLTKPHAGPHLTLHHIHPCTGKGFRAPLFLPQVELAIARRARSLLSDIFASIMCRDVVVVSKLH